MLYYGLYGRLAQLVRATRLHRVGQGFESLGAHHKKPIGRLPEALQPLTLLLAPMFAIVDIAGSQTKVSQGMKLKVPKLNVKAGEAVTFDHVLLRGSGTEFVVGTPYIAGASVQAKVLSEGKGEKIRVFKMKRRKRYRRTQGHRQWFTEIEVTGV